MIPRRIEVVEDCLCEAARFVEAIEKADERAGLIKITDGVVACVRAQNAAHACVRVAHRAKVKLLSPASCMIEQREVVKQGGAIEFGFGV